jgi:serine/threonine-protein kinase
MVAWELITGKHPFAGKTTATAMIAAHLSETPATLAGVPPALATLVARCLEKDPARRPQAASELLGALDQASTPSGERPARTPVLRGRGRAVAVVASVVVLAVVAWLFLRGSSGAVSDKSLAVLPFESVGGDTANTYFAEGIADELTTALTKVPGLRLAATSSAFSYRHTTAKVPDIGKALGVASVLQGRVRREGARMRVSAQLSSASDGVVLWSQSYEREVKDVFAVQDEITRDIVSALRVTLAVGGRSDAAKKARDMTDVETYDLYLRGLALLSQRGGGVSRSVAYFRDALRRDSSFARAWAKLGEAYCVMPLWSPVATDSVLPSAHAAIAKAHQLDPSNADAWAAEGLCDVMSLEPLKSAAPFERALSLDSSNAIANRAYWTPLALSGRADEAVAQVRRAVRVDPLSSTTAWLAGNILFAYNRRDEGLATVRRSFELDSSDASAGRLMYALLMHASGHADSARVLLKGARAGLFPQTEPWLGYLIGAIGDRSEAAAFVRRLDGERGRNAFANLSQAWTYLGSGDTTRALDALERALRAREPMGFSAPFGMLVYDPIRKSARFAAVIKGYGLDPAIFHAGQDSGK